MNNNLNNTHLVVEINIDETIVEDTIKTFNSIKDASDYIEDIIKMHPQKIFKIYQLRSIMKGMINIEREDFNS